MADGVDFTDILYFLVLNRFLRSLLILRGGSKSPWGVAEARERSEATTQDRAGYIRAPLFGRANFETDSEQNKYTP